MAKKLLIGSVFLNSTTPLMHQWFDLQRKFIQVTTIEYDYVVYVSEGKAGGFAKTVTIVPRLQLPAAVYSEAHVRGLRALLKYFQEHRQSYDNFLFLDMDAFPITKGWFDTLLQKMGNHEIAALLRCENLENRLHASVLFAKKAALDHLSFSVAEVGQDALGKLERDVCITPYQFQKRDQAFPLLRSNAVNLHPVYFGVYFDMFYHNGCGSQYPRALRATPYWSHMVSPDFKVADKTAELFSNPEGFVAQLTKP